MITMDVEGITWVGNIYQKFENMCLEVEEMMYEDTVKYIEHQVSTVGANVKKFYSDVMEDLLPPSSCDSDEEVSSDLPIDEYTDVGVCKKSSLSLKERAVGVEAKHPTENSRINHDVKKYVIRAAPNDEFGKTDALFLSASSNCVKRNKQDTHSNVESKHDKSNLGVIENRKHKKIPTTKTLVETTSPESGISRTSSSCELLNENHRLPCHYTSIDSEPTSAELTKMDSVVGRSNEIENASSGKIPNVPILEKPAGETETNMSPSSSAVLSVEPDEAWAWDAAEIETVMGEGHPTLQLDNKLNLEETCVVVSGDELQSVPNAGVDQRTKKKKLRQAFSLRKKSTRKQEYKQLAVLHGNDSKDEGNSGENLIPTSALLDHKEPEWELV
ncbi:hypothetical protein L6164_022424 [Bauhinia variegata]|uniref:Uncharacterized protein n=1 Tax=Bauhinia variegata TaxID=167791 RepID=A0ACB9MGF1_BAUVA|nr:hypothetical protein L6164_022424 [Bauhinia variegata]